MAIYRFRGQYVGRGQKLKNCVAAAAYRAGVELVDPITGERYDPRDDAEKHAVVHSEILAREDAPDWVYDRQKLWANAELARGKRLMGITAREISVALPKELTREQQVELMRSFLRDEFVSHGMVVDWNLHNDAGNPHAHFMLTTRAYGPEGFPGNQVREWDKKPLYNRWREQWAVYANRALERAGHEERIDHRSYKERGINLQPQPKRYHDHGPEVRDEKTLQWAKEQGELILSDPSGPIRAMTHQRATFAREHLLKFVNERTATPEQLDDCVKAVMASPELVELPTGRYTSREMLASERRLLDIGDELAARDAHAVSERGIAGAVERAEQRLAVEAARRGEPPPKLSDEQRQAIEHLTGSSGSLAILEGLAGAGKSFAMGVAREAWEAEGLTVVGGALAGRAASELQTGSGIESRTLASWERSWKHDYDHLTERHVLVVDEAGMLGTRQLERVVEHARQAGAKVVLVGDSEQLQPIEAGAPFRALSERLGASTLSEVRRQRVDWQREATMAFGGKRARAAVDVYQDHGHVKAHLTSEEARTGVVKAWAQGLQAGTPIDKQLMFAFRRDDVAALNELGRHVYRQRGALQGEDVEIKTANGARRMAQGERVYFGKNNRELGVKNGTLGTVERVSAQRMTVRLDGDGAPKRVLVDLAKYDHIDHAYAVTIHKSQGATLDRGYVLASKLFDSTKSYVSMSRHRDHVEMHWARDEFGSRRELMHTLTREQRKDLAVEALAENAVTLRDVLRNESLFELVSPVEQRRLIQEAEAARHELGPRVPVAHGLDAQLRVQPEVESADKKLGEAVERRQNAENERAAYDALSWLDKRGADVQLLDRQLAVARAGEKLAANAVKQHMKDPEIIARAEKQLEAHNAKVDQWSERIRDWHARVEGVALEGQREHVLEQVEASVKRPVRWSLEQDVDVPCKYVQTLPHAYGEAGQQRVALFEAPNGTLIMHEIRAHEAVGLQRGEQVSLTQNALGALELNSAQQSLGLDRGR